MKRSASSSSLSAPPQTYSAAGAAGPDQFVQAGRIPCPAVLGKPGKVRLFRLFDHVAGSVNGPREQRVVVGIDDCQAPAGKRGGDRGLPGAGTACDLDSAHRCLSSASSDGWRKRVCDPARTGAPQRSLVPHPLLISDSAAACDITALDAISRAPAGKTLAPVPAAGSNHPDPGRRLT